MPGKGRKKTKKHLHAILAAITATTLPSQAQTIQNLLAIREKLLEQTQAEKYLKNPSQFQTTHKTETKKTHPWKKNITTTVFWIGEKPSKNNPVPNDKSSWDKNWKQNYGGYDSPSNRIGFRPANFIPKQNPFYVALPYNDIGPKGTKPEAKHVIPWFNETFEKNGKSVVKGRWVAIRYKGRTAFAQWEDTGPYRTDHWQYVFGNEEPSPNKNNNAGLDVSPAVRDYLGLKGMDKTDWRFVEIWEVPNGPWTKYGENNPFSPQYVGKKTSTGAKTAENTNNTQNKNQTKNTENPIKNLAQT